MSTLTVDQFTESLTVEKVLELTCCKQLVNDQLQAVLADLDRRGQDEKPRKLVIQIEGIQTRKGVEICVQVQAKTPPMKSLEIAGTLQKDDEGYALLFGQDD